MTMSERTAEQAPEKFEYVRPLRPLHFPVEAKVHETQRHSEIAADHSVGTFAARA